MDADGASSIRELIAEAGPDVILGADIVGSSFHSYLTNCDHLKPGLRSVDHSTPHRHPPLGDFGHRIDRAASNFCSAGSHGEEP